MDIFDASMKAIKALRYDRSHLSETDKRVFKGDTSRIRRIFYPVIVFDGHLYSLYFRRGKPYPKRRECLRFYTLFKERGYQIDVVTRLGFHDYLELLNEEVRCFEQCLRKKSS